MLAKHFLRIYSSIDDGFASNVGKRKIIFSNDQLFIFQLIPYCFKSFKFSPTSCNKSIFYL